MSQTVLKYLGFELKRGQRNLLPDHSEAVARVALPTTKRQFCGFLGMAGFFHIWVANFGLRANCMRP